MLTQDRDEELVLFLEIRRRKKGHQGSDNISHTTTMSSQQYPRRSTAADNFLYAENEKSDYDWLVSPPGSPSKSLMNQLDAPDVDPMALKYQLQNCREEERDNISSKNKTIGLKRPSSSNSSMSTSRPSTPPRRSTTPATRSTTPTSRVTSTAARGTLTSSSTSSSRPTSRPSTPTRRPSSSGTSRATLTSSTRSSRSTSRTSTPTKRASISGASRANLTAQRTTGSTVQPTTGSTTSTRPTTRPMSAPNTKPGSRSSTPTSRPSTPTSSSAVLRSKPTKPVGKPAPSPTLRSRPWEPYEMPGFSLEAPSNLRTTLPDRPQTASSRRTRAFGASSGSRSASIERGVARRQSCSPSRNRAPVGNVNGDVPLLRGRRGKTSNDGGGSISPVAMGNQMVERVVSRKKLAPPRLTENGGGGGRSSAGKSSSGSDGFGFGRHLSKSSIDMALRHMDVKRGSMTGNFIPRVTKVPAASLYSVRNRPVSSSSGISESSVNILCLDGSDDNLSDISYS